MSVEYEPRYTDLGRVRRALRAPQRTFQAGGADEADLLDAINSAETLVDDYLGAPLTINPVLEETIELRARRGGIVNTPPFTTISDVRISDVAVDWSPWRSPTTSVPGFGIQSLGISAGDLVAATGKWGWPVMPGTVRQASTQLSVRLYTLITSPLGVADLGEGLAAIIPRDSTIPTLLAPYKRWW